MGMGGGMVDDACGFVEWETFRRYVGAGSMWG